MTDSETRTCQKLEQLVLRALRRFAKAHPDMTVSMVTMTVIHLAVRMSAQFLRYEEFEQVSRDLFETQRSFLSSETRTRGSTRTLN